MDRTTGRPFVAWLHLYSSCPVVARVEALNSEIKQLLDTGTLRAVKLSDDPAGASVINSTMVLWSYRPDK